jgi:signal peptidase I
MRAAAALGLAAAATAGALTTGVWLLRRRIAVVAVTGPSMRPTLVDGDRVLVRRTGPRRSR